MKKLLIAMSIIALPVLADTTSTSSSMGSSPSTMGTKSTHTKSTHTQTRRSGYGTDRSRVDDRQMQEETSDMMPSSRTHTRSTKVREIEED